MNSFHDTLAYSCKLVTVTKIELILPNLTPLSKLPKPSAIFCITMNPHSWFFQNLNPSQGSLGGSLYHSQVRLSQQAPQRLSRRRRLPLEPNWRPSAAAHVWGKTVQTPSAASWCQRNHKTNHRYLVTFEYTLSFSKMWHFFTIATICVLLEGMVPFFFGVQNWKSNLDSHGLSPASWGWQVHRPRRPAHCLASDPPLGCVASPGFPGGLT